jgi:protocatechuate 3,4-dioxygenase beta subunit/HAMP domain-containing protein
VSTASLEDTAHSLRGPGGERGGEEEGRRPAEPGVFAQIRSATGDAVVSTLPSFSVPGGTTPDPRLPAVIDPPTATDDGPEPTRYFTVPGESSSERYRVRASVDARDETMLVVATSLDDVDSTLDRLLRIELVVTALVLAGIAALGMWLVRLGLRPLDAIGETASAIAAGDLSRRVERAEDRTEVGRLGLALNAMLSQIESAFRAREASERKLRRFVADASHELRTPLAAVRAYAELFGRGASERPDDLARSMTGISRESERMSLLVDDLLLLARLDRERPHAHAAGHAGSRGRHMRERHRRDRRRGLRPGDGGRRARPRLRALLPHGRVSRACQRRSRPRPRDRRRGHRGARRDGAGRVGSRARRDVHDRPAARGRERVRLGESSQADHSRSTGAPRTVILMTDHDSTTDPMRLSRRGTLLRLAGLAAAASGGAAGLRLATADEAEAGPLAVSSGLVTCVLTPELTEGPYYVAGEKLRRDITEGKAGVPLQLRLTVVNASSCKPIRNAAVDIWHCDALGVYSGAIANNPSTNFLRGVQRTTSKGVATFDTIYPGWYPGRAVHIHVKVHVAGNVVHTGQLFFPARVSNAVYRRKPYSAHGATPDTLNASDSIFRNGGSKGMLAMTKTGAGYVGALAMGVSV